MGKKKKYTNKKGKVHTMKSTKIITFWGWESNPFANPDFANNGGGYSQPEGGALVELPNGSMAVVDYFDHNCGDFGRDAHVSVELLDGHSWGFSFGSNSDNDFDEVAPSFCRWTGCDLAEVADTVIDAVLTAMEG